MMSMEGLRGKQCKIRGWMREGVARFIGERREDSPCPSEEEDDGAGYLLGFSGEGIGSMFLFIVN